MSDDKVNVTDFILARIADDEATAWADTATSSGSVLEWEHDREQGYRYLTIDPARVLRECAAIGKIVGLHVDAGPSQGYFFGRYSDTDHACGECGSHGEYGIKWPCDMVLCLASIWSDHPHFSMLEVTK